MSAALAPYFMKLPLFKNLLIGSQITDETFGVAVQHAAQKGYLGERWMIGLNVTAYLNWILATIIGGLFGEWIPTTYIRDGLCITSNVYRIICTSAHK